MAVVLTAVVVYFGFSLKSQGSNWGDLLLNIGSEIFGIVVTVVLVERILTWRAELLQRPAKRTEYSTLLEWLDTLFHEVLFLDGNSDEALSSKQNQRNINLASAEERILKNLVAKAYEKLEPVSSPQEALNLVDREVQSVLEEKSEQLQELSTTSGELLDKALRNKLHELDQEFQKQLAMYQALKLPHYDDKKYEDTKLLKEEEVACYFEEAFKPIATAIVAVLRAAFKVRNWLETWLTRNTLYL